MADYSKISTRKEVMSVFNIPQTLLEAINSVILNEHELSRREVAFANEKYQTEINNHRHATKEISGHIFPEGQDRIVIPLESEPHPTKTAVEDHLHSNGFHSTDYRAGLTKDKYDRDVSIGKALTKTGASRDLINEFAVHQKNIAQQPDTTSHLQVVISKHPHDVIGMSQGTEWGLRPNETHLGETRPIQSCMRFDTPQHESYMKHELNAGTHVAWLTHKGDNEAKEPLARITLRPFSKLKRTGNLITHFRIKLPKVYGRELIDEFNDMAGDDEIANTPDGKKVAEILHGNIRQANDYAGDDGIDLNPYKIKVKNITHSHSDNAYHYMQVHVPDGAEHDVIWNHVKQSANYMGSPYDKISIHTSIPHTYAEPVSIPDSDQSVPENILVPGSKTYGKQVDAFKSTVKNWANKSFKLSSGTEYKAHDNIYMDGDPTTITK